MIYPVVHVPESVLSQKTQEISNPLDTDIQKLIPAMFETMHEEHGIGLAATQIGRSDAIAVIEIDTKRYIIINPSITKYSDEKVLFEEGCLSIPAQHLPIVRSEKITVRYLDDQGKKCKIKASGLLAIALQHEIDHLNGTIITDRYKEQERLRKLFS